MQTTSDSLRNTLDTLHLDPTAKADRHYLVTVLRRLGYTEAEIRAHLGEPEAPLPEEPEADEGRMVEVEYLASSESKEFERVYKQGRQAPVVEMVDAHEEDWDGDELDFVEVEPTPVEFDEEKRLRLRVVHADDEASAMAAAREQGLHVVRAFPVTVEASVEEGEWDEPAEHDAPLAAPEPTPPSGRGAEHGWQEVDDWDEDVQWEAPPEPAAEEGEWAPPEPPADGPFQYKDYTLYRRDVELATGKTQRIYFFAKGRPRSGEPSALPDGYEVQQNERTGLPFLRRSGGKA